MKTAIQLIDKLELAHFYNQLGLYFSNIDKSSNFLLSYSEIIDDYFWNYAGQININERDIGTKILEMIQYYESKKRTPSIYVTPSSMPKNLSNYLEANNFNVAFKDTWMIMEKEPASFENSGDFTINRVSNLKDMELFIKIFFRSYGNASPDEPYGALPKSYGDALINSFINPSTPDKKIIHYLGYIKGKPVGIGTLISFNGIGGIYNIGVIPECRRMGIGSELSMKAVLDSEQERNNITYLMTESGSYVEKFYKELGFAEVFNGMGYVRGKSD